MIMKTMPEWRNLVDARDLKSRVPKGTCRFDSGLGHQDMEQANFQKNLLKHTENFRKVLATPSGDWSVKGFIDIAKNIYTISVDTMVVSKIIELMMFPVIQK